MWVYRWKKKYPGLLPNEPTEPPGADMGKGGRRAAFDDEDYAALGEALKTFLNNNPMGIDAPTLSPVIYGIVDENPKWRSQLVANGGSFTMSLSWVYTALGKWGLRHRRGTNAARKLPRDFEHQKLLFNLRLAYIVRTEAARRGWPTGTVIPKRLVVNWYVVASLCRLANRHLPSYQLVVHTTLSSLVFP